MGLPLISVIIPVKPGGEVKSLRPLAEVDYPRELMEVMVAEGRRPSTQRNRAAAQAKGDVLYFLDDDSLAPPGLFKEVAGRYADPEVCVVGGPILTPQTDGFMQKGFGLALASLFGGSTIRARYKRLGDERRATENELILANLSFRRDVFIGAGGFNEDLYPNEENELMNRLEAGGGKFLYVPDAFLYRSQRKCFGAYMRQVFTYGRGRMDQNYAHPEGFKPLHLAPSVFLLYFISLLFVNCLSFKPLNNIVYFFPIILYLTLNIFFSAAAAFEGGNPLHFLVMPLLFLTLHLGYGAGFLWGAIKGIRPKGPSPPDAGGISIRRVQL